MTPPPHTHTHSLPVSPLPHLSLCLSLQWVTDNPAALPGYKGAVDEGARQAHADLWSRDGRNPELTKNGFILVADSSADRAASSPPAAAAGSAKVAPEPVNV